MRHVSCLMMGTEMERQIEKKIILWFVAAFSMNILMVFRVFLYVELDNIMQSLYYLRWIYNLSNCPKGI